MYNNLTRHQLDEKHNFCSGTLPLELHLTKDQFESPLGFEPCPVSVYPLLHHTFIAQVAKMF